MMSTRTVAAVLFILLLCGHNPTVQGAPVPKKGLDPISLLKTAGKAAIIGATVGACAYFFAPATVALLGFKATGIASGSVAAGMMSSSALAAGGGVEAGSAVAVLQSISQGGAALGVMSKGLGGLAAGGAIVADVASKQDKKKDQSR